jgi:hypothetical protein
VGYCICCAGRVGVLPVGEGVLGFRKLFGKKGKNLSKTSKKKFSKKISDKTFKILVHI